MFKNKQVGQQRSFLNEPYLTSLTSHICYSVEVQTYNSKLQEENLFDNANVKFSIADCSRNIHLDFDIESKEDMRNSLTKLDTIIRTCEAMKEDIKIARKIVLEGKKRAKELELEKEK